MVKKKTQGKATKQRIKCTHPSFGEKPTEIIKGETPLGFKKELELELEMLGGEYPELFAEEHLNNLWNEFRLRLFDSLLSEFSKTDTAKNLQKDIAEPLAAWMKIVSDISCGSFGSNREKKIIYLLQMASNFKLDALIKVKEYSKNKKPLQDFLILREYKAICKIVKPICRKRYNNPKTTRFLDLRDKLKGFEYSDKDIKKLSSEHKKLTPSTLSYNLLAIKYGKSKTTIRDIIINTRKEVELSKDIFDQT